MQAIEWFSAHLSAILEALGAFLTFATIVVGMLPASASKNKIVAFLAWLLVATHRDLPGTWKLPFSSQPLPASKPKPVEAPVSIDPKVSGR